MILAEKPDLNIFIIKTNFPCKRCYAQILNSYRFVPSLIMRIKRSSYFFFFRYCPGFVFFFQPFAFLAPFRIHIFFSFFLCLFVVVAVVVLHDLAGRIQSVTEVKGCTRIAQGSSFHQNLCGCHGMLCEEDESEEWHVQGRRGLWA